MYSFHKLITPCSLIAAVAKQSSLRKIPIDSYRFCAQIRSSFSLRFYTTAGIILQEVHVLGVRNMSQKSITSFFQKTPKKVAEVKEESQVQDEWLISPSETETQDKTSPPPNEIQKRTSKRSRLDSSSSDHSTSISRETSSISSGKKKKTKRQRIESSESESDPKTEGNEASPKQGDEIKLEKVETPRTYESSKAKKSNNKLTKTPLVEKNVTSNEKATPKSKMVKREKSVEKSIKLEEKSPSPDRNKIAVSSGDKEFKGFFIKKDKKDEKDEGKEGGGDKVKEEEYNPSKLKYHPVKDACWSRGQPVPYLALAKTLEVIEATSARLKMIEILANYLRSVMVLTPDDLLASVYLCLNQLAPAYHSLELGIAETYLMKAIGQSTGRTVSQLRSAAHKAGDLGRVAESARAAQRTMFEPQPLLLRKVFAALKEIASMTGQSSVNKKIAKIQSLYTACRHSEARYLIRSLEGKLRIGLAEQSLLQALALACTLTPPGPGGITTLDASKGLSAEQFKARYEEQALTIKTTYCECPNYELVVAALMAHGVAALPARCRLTPGVPLKPMLAHPTRGLDQLFARFDGAAFTCEWKYDGERAQIHVPVDGGGRAARLDGAAVFSRNQENTTSKYPDVVRRLAALLRADVTSCVLDAEVVAYDVDTKKILPFQILSTRKRKDALEAEIKVHVCVFVFDLLYLNGEPLVTRPLEARRELLRTHFNEVPGEWQFATSKDCSSVEEVQQFLEEAIRGSCEGLMVKTLGGADARYDIARRSHNWLKLKKDYLDGVGDTIDAVVIGAFRGKGRRAGVLGGFLLACYDADSDEYQTLCKIGTGFSDDDLKTFTEALQSHFIDAPKGYYRFDTSHVPDVWLSPSLVWEVRCADLSLSPAHRAAIGLVDPDKGISLRFPRFVRVRTDKRPEQATSARQIAELYSAQDVVKSQPKRQDHDDFY